MFSLGVPVREQMTNKKCDDGTSHTQKQPGLVGVRDACARAATYGAVGHAQGGDTLGLAARSC